MNSQQKQTRDRGKYSQTQDGQASCGKCSEKMYRKNLQSHFNTKHDQESAFEKAPEGVQSVRDLMKNRIEEEKKKQDEKKKQEDARQRERAEAELLERQRLQELEEAQLREQQRLREVAEAQLQEQTRLRELAEQTLREQQRLKEAEDAHQEAESEAFALRELQNAAAAMEFDDQEEEEDLNTQLKEAEQILEKDGIFIDFETDNWPEPQVQRPDSGHEADLERLQAQCSNSSDSHQQKSVNDQVMQAQQDVLGSALQQEPIAHELEQQSNLRGPQQVRLPSCQNDVQKRAVIPPRKRQRSQLEEIDCDDVANVRENFQDKVLKKLSDIQEAVQEASSQDELKRKMDEICNQLKEMAVTNGSTDQHSGNKAASRSSKVPAYNVEKMAYARTADNIADYVSRLQNVALHYACLKDKREDKPDGIYCTDCAVEVAPVPYGSYPGVVRCKEDSSKKQFQNLKSNMQNHMDSKAHRKNVGGQHLELEKEAKKLNETAGVHCARLAYNAITKSHSYLAYETDVTVADANGTYVGSKNHSREFCRDMVEHFYESMKEKFQEQITTPLPGTLRPSPLTDICDKWTGNGRTYNVTGVNAYGGNKLNTYFVDSYVVQDHTGKGIAKSMVESNDNVLDDGWRNRYVGTCSDGAMLNLNYKDEMDKLVNEGAGKDPLASDFYSHLWDGGHVVELAHKDTHSQQHEWVKDTQNVITEVNHKFKYGKKREEARNVAEEHDERMYAPQGWSTTRWSAYASGTFDKTYKNYKTYYECLDNSQDDLLDKFNSADYVLRSTVLSDIAEERSKLSRTVQVPDIYCWNVQRTVQQTCDNLQTMADTLANPAMGQNALDYCRSPTENYKLLPKFSETVRELLDTGTHQGMPILEKQHFPTGQSTRHRTSSVASTGDFNTRIETTRTKAAAYLQDTIKSLNKRFNNEKSQILNHAADLFDMERVLDRDPGSIPEPAFTQYATGAYNAKVLDQHPVGPPPTWHQLRTEYKAFQNSVHNHVKEKFEQASTNVERRKIEKKFYDGLILKGLHGAENFPASNQLLATATVRLRNESQVESMASQLKIIVENRNLDPKKVSQEAFLTRNGPPPNKNADGLLRDGLRRKFSGPPEKWTFTHTSDRPDKLKFKSTSVVIDRKNEEDGRVVYKHTK